MVTERGDLMKITEIAAKDITKDKLKVAAYCRVSTEADEQENSLGNQKDYYENEIRSNPGYEYAGVYADFGISGFKEERPEFQKMIKAAMEGDIDLILTKSISRFARNTVTLLKTVRMLKAKGVGIFFELQNINSLSAEGELMISIHAAFAQAESEDSSMNAYMSYQKKFRSGIPAVRVHDCFGYCLDADGKIVADTEQSQAVVIIYSLAVQGVWPSKIKQYLNKNGITTATGKKWDDSAVFRILRNEIYKGDVMMQKTYQDADRVRHKNRGERDRFYIPNHHPAIVSEEIWNEVQEILDERSRKLKEKKEPAVTKGNSHSSYPLTGKLFCPHCGKMLHHRIYNGGRQRCWVCSSKVKKGADSCIGVSVPEEIADGWNITEETTVFSRPDRYGMIEYVHMPKAEFEASGRCPYWVEKKKGRYSHTVYPLSGKMYCGLCGTVMHHQFAWNGKEYWLCGSRAKQKGCAGIKVPAEIADGWNFEGTITVMEGEDADGKRSYSYKGRSKADNENGD